MNENLTRKSAGKRARRILALVAGGLLAAPMVLTPAEAAPGPPPAGVYKGTTIQTHSNSYEVEDERIGTIQFKVDASGRITELDAPYFWYCSGLYETDNFNDDPPTSPQLAKAGVAFDHRWETDVREYRFHGTIDANGSGSGGLVMDMGICGESRLTWKATRQFQGTAPYTLEGEHTINGRKWRTTCSPYSRTERCRAEIWASVVVNEGGTYQVRQGWAFNNLTYLPLMDRASWSENPLAQPGEWTAADGRRWRTECDTPATGRDGCRSYARVTIVAATARPQGGYTFTQTEDWLFNNIVMFQS